jgi:HK97 family phage prohead protease
MTDYRNLPDGVRERLAAANVDLDRRHRGFDIDIKGKTLEYRATQRVEVRQADDGSPLIAGYASVYDARYDVMGGPPHGWTEVISRGAAAKSVNERDDVYLFFNHDGFPLAATKAGTLVLDGDDRVGLYAEARPDTRSAYSMEIVHRMERRELDAMSFAFQVVRQQWENEDGERADPKNAPIRRIQEVKLFDVSVVSFPANPATAVQLKSARPVDAMSVDDVRALLDELRRTA